MQGRAGQFVAAVGPSEIGVTQIPFHSQVQELRSVGSRGQNANGQQEEEYAYEQYAPHLSRRRGNAQPARRLQTPLASHAALMPRQPSSAPYPLRYPCARKPGAATMAMRELDDLDDDCLVKIATALYTHHTLQCVVRLADVSRRLRFACADLIPLGRSEGARLAHELNRIYYCTDPATSDAALRRTTTVHSGAAMHPLVLRLLESSRITTSYTVYSPLIDAAKSVAKMLAQNSSLRFADIAINAGEERHVLALVSAVQNHPNLLALRVGIAGCAPRHQRYYFGDDSLARVLDAPCKLTSLAVNGSLGRLDRTLEALATNASVTRFEVCHGVVVRSTRSRSRTAWRTAFPCPSLDQEPEEVQLQHEQQHFVRRLSQMLKENSSLQELRLLRCMLGGEIGVQIFVALSATKAPLRLLDLAHNDFRIDDVDAIAKQVVNMQHLERLSFDDNERLFFATTTRSIDSARQTLQRALAALPKIQTASFTNTMPARAAATPAPVRLENGALVCV